MTNSEIYSALSSILYLSVIIRDQHRYEDESNNKNTVSIIQVHHIFCIDSSFISK